MAEHSTTDFQVDRIDIFAILIGIQIAVAAVFGMEWTNAVMFVLWGWACLHAVSRVWDFIKSRRANRSGEITG